MYIIKNKHYYITNPIEVKNNLSICPYKTLLVSNKERIKMYIIIYLNSMSYMENYNNVS